MRVIGDVIRLNAKRYPDKTCLIMDESSMTYGQLNREVNRLSRGLAGLGVGPGDKVAILAFNCLEYPLIVYAIAKTGATVVPINFRYKENELAYVVNNSEPKLLFYGAGFADLIGRARPSFELPLKLVSINGGAGENSTGMADLMEGESASEPQRRRGSLRPGLHHVYERNNRLSQRYPLLSLRLHRDFRGDDL